MSEKINKKELTALEDIIYDNLYTEDLVECLSSNKDKYVKTITWFEYESL